MSTVVRILSCYAGVNATIYVISVSISDYVVCIARCLYRAKGSIDPSFICKQLDRYGIVSFVSALSKCPCRAPVQCLKLSSRTPPSGQSVSSAVVYSRRNLAIWLHPLTDLVHLVPATFVVCRNQQVASCRVVTDSQSLQVTRVTQVGL
jgi:hypothetical protein